MKSFFKTISSALVILMVLTSCSSNSDKNPKDNSSTQSQSETKVETKVTLIKTDFGVEIPEIALKNKKVKALVIGPANDLLPGGVINTYFSKYYGGELELDPVPASDILTTLSAKVMSGESPDIVASHSGFPALAVNDTIVPVNDMIDFSLQITKPLESAYQAVRYNNNHYMLPVLSINTSSVVYNKKIFEDNEMPTPRELYEQGKWDWNAFRESAIKLTLDEDADGNPERWGLGMVGWQSSRLALTTGKNIVKIDGTNIQSNLADADIEKSFSFLFNLVYNDKAASPNRDMFFCHDGLDNGKIAMVMTADFIGTNPKFMKTLKTSGTLEFVPYPKYPEASEYFSPGYVTGYFIPAGADNIDGVKAFIYSTIAALYESRSPGSEAYETKKEQFLKLIPDGDIADYEKLVGWYNEYIGINKVPDIYGDIFDMDSIYVEMTTPDNISSYKQVQARLEPVLNERISNVNNQ